MMTKREIAMQLFGEGYNCAQSVAAAFSEETGLPKEALIKMASGFGGGIGRLREVCGAVSGMVLVCNMLYGYESPTDGESKKNYYKDIQSLLLQFKSRNGTYICRDLLSLPENNENSPVPETRTAEYYKRRPCKELVGDAAEILEKYINEHE